MVSKSWSRSVGAEHDLILILPHMLGGEAETVARSEDMHFRITLSIRPINANVNGDEDGYIYNQL